MKSEKKMQLIKKITLATALVLTGLLTTVPGNAQNAEARDAGIGAVTFKSAAQSRTAAQAAISDNWRLVISEDGLRIQKVDGSDWYWLGDTAWSLFQELNREDAEFYFSTRASQGFTVVQAVVVMGWNRDWNEENAYGHHPFHDGDASNPNEAFWQHADWLINKAKEYGLYVALLPAWGSYWGKQATVEYAQWITNHYKDYDNVIWINGGDRKVGSAKELFNEIGNVFHTDEDSLATFHPRGGDHSSKHFHNEQWLDFNMQQSSHGRRDIRADIQVDADLAKTPTKPTLNGEPNYEDHCVGWKSDCSLGTFNAHDVRQLAYWTVFAGATGITYGHVHVWDFYHGGNREDGYKDWKVQMKDPGAVQMGYLANLMMSRPHTGRAPAQHILTNESPSGLKQRAIMGNGYAFVYTSQGHKMHVNLDGLPWEQNKAWWFNPREGKATQIDIPNSGNHTFDPPGESGEDNDWVLVIDDAGKGWTAPGQEPLPVTTKHQSVINMLINSKRECVRRYWKHNSLLTFSKTMFWDR